uniref:ERI1 exoribonuclease 2 n=1 Tax=Cebus imitator TaxID=2715852 RepID=A0A2K5R8P9_CEBIM
MATKRLARQLGLIRRKSIASANGNLGRSKSKQLFDYLIVIDFESTCWNDGKRHHSQEIIEFPAVLLNTSTGQTESEFHAYVQPQEHPILSEFCMELTGIKQTQVDEGVPLKICLSRFCKWIHKIQQQKKIIFAAGVSEPSTSEVNLCAFVTWSDWDLGVCLEYECKRKQLLKPVFLNSWIDLRATYKLFYRRKPKGLSGALQEVGIEFSGREHSGLDDSRNTALLAWKMIRDGCLMKITRSLNKVSNLASGDKLLFFLQQEFGYFFNFFHGTYRTLLQNYTSVEVYLPFTDNPKPKLLWVCPVIFGDPVVPLVKKMAIISLCFVFTQVWLSLACLQGKNYNDCMLNTASQTVTTEK